MAAATSSSSAALVRAVVLPFMLVLLAVAAGASISEDGPAVAKSGGPLSETPVGRKLRSLEPLELCGSGSAPDFDCKVILGVDAFNATCCTDPEGNQGCWDVGAFWLTKCGSCNTTCKLGEVCCYGACVNLLTDNNNCGACRHKCHGKYDTCKEGFCNY